MEKKLQVRNIKLATNAEFVVVNVDSLPNYISNEVCSKKYIPQILYNDAYWILIQDFIGIEAANRKANIETSDIVASYWEDIHSLELYLSGCWSVNNLACLYEIFNIPGDECHIATIEGSGMLKFRIKLD